MTRTILFRGTVIPLASVSIMLGASACGGTVAFQGQKAFMVSGSSSRPPASMTPPMRQHVAVRANKIEIDEKIQFEHDKAVILEVSHGLLNEVTQVMKDNPQIKKVLIEGHASSDGEASHNMKLSDERAKAVMKYLVDHGIDKGRLSAKGFGSTEPLADNKTEDGREKNRRVEFTIIEPAATGGTK
jgi:outer membrane protein OmpA-like peptidoglycan-associated protein